MKKEHNSEETFEADAPEFCENHPEVCEEDITATADAEVEPYEVMEKLKTENEKLKEDVLRAYAYAENTKRRALQEIEKNNKYAISSFAKDLLSVADNLERAINSASNDKDCENLIKGIEMTQTELSKVFEKFGIVKMDILDMIFDPNYHQAVQEVEDPSKPAGTITVIIQPGYMINDRILREAMVVVTKS